MKLAGYFANAWCELGNPRWRPRWPPFFSNQGKNIKSSPEILFTMTKEKL